MPEIDLTIKKNRNAFIDWRHKMIESGRGRIIGEGDLNIGRYIYSDLINGEPVIIYADSSPGSLLPEALISAHVSHNHAKELREKGVIFERGSMPERTVANRQEGRLHNSPRILE